MGRYAQDTGGGDFKQAPVGNHVARCYSLIDIGTQHGEYQGKPNAKNQIRVSWELCNELMEDNQPFTVSHFYTNSLNEKATLRRHLEAWRGQTFKETELAKFDLMAILGKPCMLNIVLNEKGKAKVASVAAIPKGITAPVLQNKKVAFWIEEWDEEAFQAIPDGIRKIIEQSDEFKARVGGAADMESDEPWKDEATPDTGVPF